MHCAVLPQPLQSLVVMTGTCETALDSSMAAECSRCQRLTSDATTMARRPSQARDSIQFTALRTAVVAPRHALTQSTPYGDKHHGNPLFRP